MLVVIVIIVVIIKKNTHKNMNIVANGNNSKYFNNNRHLFLLECSYILPFGCKDLGLTLRNTRTMQQGPTGFADYKQVAKSTLSPEPQHVQHGKGRPGEKM